MRRLVGTLSAFGLLFAASTASAQVIEEEEQPLVEQDDDDLDVDVDVDVDEPEPLVPYGMSVVAGGGIAGFTDENMRDLTGTAGTWQVRATWGHQLPIAAEIAYVGAAQEIDALGLDNDAVLLTTGFEATARVNVLQDVEGMMGIQPYAFAGLGWTRFDLTNFDVNTSSVEEDDNVLSIPLGLGVSYRWGRILGDLRGTYRPMAGEDLVPLGVTDQNDSADLDNWSVALHVGASF